MKLWGIGPVTSKRKKSMGKLDAARHYAIKVHAATNHKYDGKPYEVHLQMVYDFACKYIHLLSDNEISEALAAAWVCNYQY